MSHFTENELVYLRSQRLGWQAKILSWGIDTHPYTRNSRQVEPSGG